jgi:hypothetical protein
MVRQGRYYFLTFFSRECSAPSADGSILYKRLARIIEIIFLILQQKGEAGQA